MDFIVSYYLYKKLTQKGDFTEEQEQEQEQAKIIPDKQCARCGQNQYFCNCPHQKSCFESFDFEKDNY